MSMGMNLAVPGRPCVRQAPTVVEQGNTIPNRMHTRA